MADDPPPASEPTSASPPLASATQPQDAVPAPTDPQPVANSPATAADSPGTANTLGDQIDIDELLKQASFEDPSAATDGATANVAAPAETAPFDLPNFQQVMRDAQVSSIDLLRDVELNVKIELGRSRMLVEDVLKLGEGSVVEVGKLAGDRVDVCVKGRLVARGELRVLPDNFGWPVHGIAAAV